MPDKKILVKAVLFGSLISLVFTIILLCILTVVELTSGLMSSEIVNIAAMAMLAAGTFFGGLIAARITKEGGMITGLITGAAVFFLVTIAALIHSSESISIITLIRFICEIITGAAGGIIGVNKREKLHIK